MSWVNLAVSAGGALSGGGQGGGFLSGLGNFAGELLPGLISGFGGAQALQQLNQGRQDILDLPGSDPLSLRGAFGQSFGSTGFSQLNPQLQGLQGILGAAAPGLLAGGFSQTPGVGASATEAGATLSGNFQGLQSALGTQAGSQAFGGLGGLFNQASNLGNILSNQTAAGPQDFSGGAQNALLAGGLGNLQAAGNQQGLFNQSLATQRQAATQGGLLDRAINTLQNRQFNTGRLGSTGGAQETQSFLDAVARQDLGFQNNAFNQAQQQQQFLGGLGQGQVGLGQRFLDQNLGQFTNTANLASNFLGRAGGLEGQGFNQALGALQQNQTAAGQRLASAQQQLGFADELFSSSFGRGLGATEGLLGLGQFGLDVSALPFELQAGLLSASGSRAGALADIATARANASGGLFGGIADTIGGLFGK